jgi:hypothetical protein
VKLAAVKGVRPVSTRSVEDTARELTKLILEARGVDSAHDPGVALAAQDAAEMAHDNGAKLVAVVEHPDADPGVLVGMVVQSDGPLGPDSADELRAYLEDGGGADIREVTEASTERGYPVVIAERILLTDPLRTGPPTGCQLQAVVIEPGGRTLAVFTLHSVTGRGWLELAGVLGALLSTVDFG